MRCDVDFNLVHVVLSAYGDMGITWRCMGECKVARRAYVVGSGKHITKLVFWLEDDLRFWERMKEPSGVGFRVG